MLTLKLKCNNELFTYIHILFINECLKCKLKIKLIKRMKLKSIHF